MFKRFSNAGVYSYCKHFYLQGQVYQHSTQLKSVIIYLRAFECRSVALAANQASARRRATLKERYYKIWSLLIPPARFLLHSSLREKAGWTANSPGCRHGPLGARAPLPAPSRARERGPPPSDGFLTIYSFACLGGNFLRPSARAMCPCFAKKAWRTSSSSYTQSQRPWVALLPPGTGELPCQRIIKSTTLLNRYFQSCVYFLHVIIH